MFKKLFKSKSKPESKTAQTLEKLRETVDALEKKEQLLIKKASLELERAKEFSRAKNKRAAIQCLKKKKMYETQIESVGNCQLRLHDQMIMLEGAQVTTETFATLRTGASTMKNMQKDTNISNVDKTMDEINEQAEQMKEIQKLLEPNGEGFDEDELEAELAELEGADLEDTLLQPITVSRLAPVYTPAKRHPTNHVSLKEKNKKTAEEEEMDGLAAEMAAI